MTPWPWWLTLNVAALDAPLVAVVWQAAFGRAWSVSLSFADRGLLFLAVWLVYLLDRWIDAQRNAVANSVPSARHRAFRSVPRWLGLVWIGAALAGIGTAFVVLTPVAWRAGWMLVGALAVYGIWVHRHDDEPRGKEWGVGIMFAAGTVLLPAERSPLLEWSSAWAPTAAFACLCAVNCQAIALWERNDPPPCRAGRRREFLASIALGAMLTVASVAASACAIALSVALGLGAILALDRFKNAISVSARRVFVDAALLGPLLF